MYNTQRELLAARQEARQRGFLVGRRVVLRWDRERRVGRITGLNHGISDNPVLMPVMVQFPWWDIPVAWSLDCLELVN